jgi:hypothetical protein
MTLDFAVGHPEKLAAVHAAFIAQCDAKDGVTDAAS